ncbi:hypothetical protein HNP84_005324 [Thermocatellispora tengchongensis]|uniref:DUF1707 domain-containing protein n=1 Tax=Thermocatellispora tengchongensis TaxID=1073253 RepID=A0A840PDR7_9ACTN|nr:DUF1707 domain-containing protein [Thermocatellispora tengchongensis]MBB5135580.1 hypothetical protein [Thermocatellispora tengchongensis]
MTTVSDLDRERAVELVQQAYADGRLSPAELELRLEQALTATSSHELEPAVAGLPDEWVRLESIGGRITRTGDWNVPRRLRIDSEYGKVKLDLSQAHIPYAQVEIELCLTYGGATIILPAGASADADGLRTEWGRVTCQASRRSAGGPHVRITGKMPYGRLAVRTARK